MLRGMSKAPVLLRLAPALCLLFPVACATSQANSANGVEARGVRTSPLSGGRVRLSFEPVAPNPTLEVLSVEEAQVALTVFHEALLAERPEIRCRRPYPFPAVG